MLVASPKADTVAEASYFAGRLHEHGIDVIPGWFDDGADPMWVESPTPYGPLYLLVERFAPVLDACKKYGVTFDLECHPSERAMGDLESASDYINHMNKAGYSGTVGFNLDGSHLEWQNVSVIQFIREFQKYVHCAHVKGVQVEREHCQKDDLRNGLKRSGVVSKYGLTALCK